MCQCCFWTSFHPSPLEDSEELQLHPRVTPRPLKWVINDLYMNLLYNLSISNRKIWKITYLYLCIAGFCQDHVQNVRYHGRGVTHFGVSGDFLAATYSIFKHNIIHITKRIAWVCIVYLPAIACPSSINWINSFRLVLVAALIGKSSASCSSTSVSDDGVGF